MISNRWRNCGWNNRALAVYQPVTPVRARPHFNSPASFVVVARIFSSRRGWRNAQLRPPTAIIGALARNVLQECPCAC